MLCFCRLRSTYFIGTYPEFHVKSRSSSRQKFHFFYKIFKFLTFFGIAVIKATYPGPLRGTRILISCKRCNTIILEQHTWAQQTLTTYLSSLTLPKHKLLYTYYIPVKFNKLPAWQTERGLNEGLKKKKKKGKKGDIELS